MTTNHHTPLTSSSPANANTFNNVFSELDAALTATKDVADRAENKADNVDQYAKTTRNHHLAQERDDREAEDSRLNGLIANEIGNRIQAVSSEAAFREQMDNLEADHRVAGDEQERQAREQAFAFLNTNITLERQLRELADNVLHQGIIQEADSRRDTDNSILEQQTTLRGLIIQLSTLLNNSIQVLSRKLSEQSTWPDTAAEFNLYNLRRWAAQIAKIQQQVYGARATLALFGNGSNLIAEPIRQTIGAGAGFVSAAEIEKEGLWQDTRDASGRGPDGREAISVDDQTPGRIVISQRFQSCQILFLMHPQGGRFRVSVTGFEWIEIDSRDTTERLGIVTLTGSNLQSEIINLEILTAAAGCSVVLFGFAFDNDSLIRIHDFMNPMDSTRFRELARSQIFKDALVALNIDTSVLSFFDEEDSYDSYQLNLSLIGYTLQTYCDLLYLLPPESPAWRYNDLLSYTIATRKMLITNKDSFAAIDLRLILGRYQDALARGLWQAGALSPVGGQVIANILVDALGILTSVATPSRLTEEEAIDRELMQLEIRFDGFAELIASLRQRFTELELFFPH